MINVVILKLKNELYFINIIFKIWNKIKKKKKEKTLKLIYFDTIIKKIKK